MDKARFLTLMGVAGMAVILAASSPLSYVRADHCHTTPGQTPQAPSTPPASGVGAQASRPQPRDLSEDTRPQTPVRGTTSQHNTHAASRQAASTISPSNTATVSIEQIYSRDLPLAIESLERAVKAVESGDRQTELAELSKAVNTLAAIREALGKHVLSEASESKDLSPSTPSAAGVGAQAARPQARDLANGRCPIMGSPIKADAVTANLTRDYKGQKIGFCCGGCPAAWDKLTDAEKQAKLNAVKS